ncbi:MAG: sigma factor-like helix-turn-helix DNA-binding protein [Archangium sp.]|nr:sigma factor-like helix-turn-helix DNA-binding protein [Archangium sp.]MDP3154679.1 sigma factor-like helix-turn-helix DNA-binding protein [Archangium sp.]MDP3572693.1 sigma factor-like helix-turn-helix DNA-binding protein [Archangium sp.]
MDWEVTAEELAAWARAHPGVPVGVDVRLSLACARGDPLALASFDAQFRDPIEAIVRPLGDADFVSEVSQRVRQRLLMPDGATPPRIAGFAGRGSLLKFVQAVALRTALNLRQESRRYVSLDPDEAILELPSSGNDPELELLKLRFRAEFKASISAAMQTLEADLRTALRQVYLDGLTLAEVGKLHGWSVATASRRLATARAEVLARTRLNLGAQLRLAPHELDSMLRLIESRLSLETLET